MLLFDGVFLLRPELIGRWDLRVYVSTAFEATVDRAPQQLYDATVRPTDHADIIVHNDDPRRPVWETGPAR